MKKRTVLLACLALMLSAAPCIAQAETFSPETYQIDAAEVHTVVIEATDRSVEVVASTDGTIRVDCYQSEKEYYQFDLSEGTLRVTLEQDRQWYDFFGFKSDAEYRAIRLSVPEDALSSLQIETTNEDVTLEPISLGASASIRVNGGNIRFDALEVGEALTLEVKNGDICGTVLGSVDEFTISAQVKKGESNLPEQMGDGEKALEVSANNGDIDINFHSPEAAQASP